MLKIAHIVNPVIKDDSSDLAVAQPITFATIKIAENYARKNNIKIELYSAQFSEDSPIIPEYFSKTSSLNCSITDLKNFQKNRKLPLLKDILDRLYEASNSDCLIYSNIDIALMPSFYVSVAKIIEQGYDAFIINRRTISDRYKTVNQIPLMYSELGEPHPGYDCFIFSKNAYSKYQLNHVFLGVPPVGTALAINLICNATKFEEFKDLHLTFHLGDNGSWQRDDCREYLNFNQEETNNIIRHYLQKNQLANHEIIDNYLANNLLKFMSLEVIKRVVIFKLSSLFSRLQELFFDFSDD
jgi:hypothetical protein